MTILYSPTPTHGHSFGVVEKGALAVCDECGSFAVGTACDYGCYWRVVTKKRAHRILRRAAKARGVV